LARQVQAVPELRDALNGLSVEGGVLAVSTLRGELAGNKDWKRDPSRPAVIIETVDMVGSRLLFSGYGDGKWHHPHHAGLLGRNPVNALLSLGYSLLAKDLTVACYAVGFDPYVGYYHQPRFGRPALALDLMEPFRPLIVDSAVLTAINTGMVTPRDFVRVGGSVALTTAGRKGFFRAYELRMDPLVTHPLFDYRSRVVRQ